MTVPMLPPGDCLPPDLIAAAMRLVGAVRDEGRDEVNAVLTGVDLRGLCVTLAAMVPDDQTPGELLSWADRRHRAPVQCINCHIAFIPEKPTGVPPKRCRTCRARHAPAPMFVPERCDDPYVGTDTGYMRHVRSAPKTVACRACRAAHTEAERRRVVAKQRRHLVAVPAGGVA